MVSPIAGLCLGVRLGLCGWLDHMEVAVLPESIRSGW
jgi:hypothetical protein